MIKDTDGGVSFAALDAKQKKSRIEQLVKDYKSAYKDYRAAKKDGDGSIDRPAKPAVKDYKKIKGKKKADAAVAKLEEKYEEFLAKKQAKEAETDEPTDDEPAGDRKS